MKSDDCNQILTITGDYCNVKEYGSLLHRQKRSHSTKKEPPKTCCVRGKNNLAGDSLPIAATPLSPFIQEEAFTPGSIFFQCLIQRRKTVYIRMHTHMGGKGCRSGPPGGGGHGDGQWHQPGGSWHNTILCQELQDCQKSR